MNIGGGTDPFNSKKKNATLFFLVCQRDMHIDRSFLTSNSHRLCVNIFI
jgi:hypothetical protein